jgi:hypothetical protein
MKRGLVLLLLLVTWGCNKSDEPAPLPPAPPSNFTIKSWLIGDSESSTTNQGISASPDIKLRFSTKIDRASVASSVSLAENSGAPVNYTTTYENADSVIVIRPATPLSYLSLYKVNATTNLRSVEGGKLSSAFNSGFLTRIDSSRKFPAISDDSLLTLVQKQTFRYFWDFAHPVSGLARDRTTSGDLVTSGGSGFGIMSIPVAVSRGFITRAQALSRMQTIVAFLKTAEKFHGAFPHFLNGVTGKVIPFSTKDNGADLVETSFLMMGLLTARQYFDGSDAAEIALRNDINTLYNGVEWSWFRKDNGSVLYWHWSPNYGWDMNLPIRGWNECLVTYVLSAASSTYTIPATVYDNGWAGSGSSGFINGKSFYGYQLPLGPDYGGPLFFSHYSFLGVKPEGLNDKFANYKVQQVNHSQINYNYCKTNPLKYYGYSDSVWGLTASDIPGGYTASSPTNDRGVIAPTAAVSSIPYTPTESMKAIKFFYYVLGDKLWGEYGFKDAFALKDPWFANSYLAIDQGPMIVMIENYRTGLVWDLFSSCPEVKAGMKKLGFSAPYL